MYPSSKQIIKHIIPIQYKNQFKLHNFFTFSILENAKTSFDILVDCEFYVITLMNCLPNYPPTLTQLSISVKE